MPSGLGFEVRLKMPLEQAVGRVTDALKAEGFGVLTRIDVQQTFRERLQIDFRPYVILGACNPGLARRALERKPEAGLLLPCNVTVETDGDDTVVRIGNPDVLMGVGDLEQDPQLRELASEARIKLERAARHLE